MLIEFLVEEPSTEEALKHLLPNLIRQRARWKIINLGSKYKLLKVLPQRLAAYRQRIDSKEDLRVVVLVDVTMTTAQHSNVSSKMQLPELAW